MVVGLLLSGPERWLFMVVTHCDSLSSLFAQQQSCSIVIIILGRAESSYLVHDRASLQAWWSSNHPHQHYCHMDLNIKFWITPLFLIHVSLLFLHWLYIILSTSHLPSHCHTHQASLFSNRHSSVWDVASCTCCEEGRGAQGVLGEAPASAGKQGGTLPL